MVPTGFVLSIVNAWTTLPYPTNIDLPVPDPLTGEVPLPVLSGPKIVLPLPESEEHHIILGRFMAAWSRLEATVVGGLTSLGGLDDRPSRIFSAALGWKQMVDTLEALTECYPEHPSLASVARTCDRIHRITSRRNVVVHGLWFWEATIVVISGHPTARCQMVRQQRPISPADADAMSDPKNQKIRSRYRMELRDIEEATSMVNQISLELNRAITDAAKVVSEGTIIDVEEEKVDPAL